MSVAAHRLAEDGDVAGTVGGSRRFPEGGVPGARARRIGLVVVARMSSKPVLPSISYDRSRYQPGLSSISRKTWMVAGGVRCAASATASGRRSFSNRPEMRSSKFQPLRSAISTPLESLKPKTEPIRVTASLPLLVHASVPSAPTVRTSAPTHRIDRRRRDGPEGRPADVLVLQAEGREERPHARAPAPVAHHGRRVADERLGQIDRGAVFGVAIMWPSACANQLSCCPRSSADDRAKLESAVISSP